MDQETFSLIAVLIMCGLVALFFIGVGVGNDAIQDQAVARGYAIHCPLDGRFAWKDECK